MGFDQAEGPLKNSVPLTTHIAIKLRVEVLLRVKWHLDPISHLQPLVGDRQTQVLGQGSSKAQAGEGISHSCMASDWALSVVLGWGRGCLVSDLFCTRTLVYTELFTPEWYSSGGMTPGHTGPPRQLV